jgi:hypothetical protein
MKKFEIGKTYIYKFYGDRDVAVPCQIIKRTAKTITYMELDENKTFTRKIRETFGVECVSTGSYSMAPTLYADRVA